MKKRTKSQKIGDYYDAFRCIREGKPVKRTRAKDGSVPTHSVVEVPDNPESQVVSDCLMWLKSTKGAFCNRHDAGTFQNIRGQWGTYGIKNAGDIIGLLPNGRGTHFEIEVKRGRGGRLSIGQQKRMRDVRENHGIYLICHGVEELEYYNEKYHYFT